MFADVDGSMVHTETRPDHVLGVGAATLSLLRITPSSPARTVLDLGTGSGVQLVHALDSGAAGTGTDITPRCLELAEATLAINALEAELLRGPWFEPVAGRRFDRSYNPPFVVGPPETGIPIASRACPWTGPVGWSCRALPTTSPTGHRGPLRPVEREDVDWRPCGLRVPSEGSRPGSSEGHVDPGLYVDG